MKTIIHHNLVSYYCLFGNGFYLLQYLTYKVQLVSKVLS